MKPLVILAFLVAGCASGVPSSEPDTYEAQDGAVCGVPTISCVCSATEPFHSAKCQLKQVTSGWCHDTCDPGYYAWTITCRCP